MKKRKTAALYNPYLDTLGGGEKHILSIFKVLDQHDFEPHIFWDTNLTKEIAAKFNLSFTSDIIYHKNIFKDASSIIDKIRQLKNFDMFFYVTDGSYFISSAKKNYIFSMVPQKDLYNMNVLNKIKTMNVSFICNSEFTQKWLDTWGVSARVIHPYINDDILAFSLEGVKKEKIILSVGRFFGHLHTKKHDAIIQAFKNLKKRSKYFSDFKLILAGGLTQENQDYYDSIVKLIGTDKSIILKPNVSYTDLVDLYQKSYYYWHFAGFGIDENIHPEQVEHFGITPLEAMASGCIVFCYEAGGPKDIIQSGKNGYLFKNDEELYDLIHESRKNIAEQVNMSAYAQTYVRQNFSYEVFKKRVEEVILK